eukprot:163807-Prymnesium_polylepis.1
MGMGESKPVRESSRGRGEMAKTDTGGSPTEKSSSPTWSWSPKLNGTRSSGSIPKLWCRSESGDDRSGRDSSRASKAWALPGVSASPVFQRRDSDRTHGDSDSSSRDGSPHGGRSSSKERRKSRPGAGVSKSTAFDWAGGSFNKDRVSMPAPTSRSGSPLA